MSDDNQKKKSGGSGMSAVWFLLIVMLGASFFSEKHPMDAMADMIMSIVWVMSIGLFVLVAVLIFAHVFKQAILEFYEALLEDYEDSEFKRKIIWVKEKIYGQAMAKKDSDQNEQSDDI